MIPPFVLVHGWGSSPRVWDALLASLTTQVVAGTAALPGHGGVASCQGGLDAWADALLAELPPTSALCGWSLGALVAMKAALRAPKRISRLILIGASPSFVKRPNWPSALDVGEVAQFQQAFAAEPESLNKRFRALQALGDSRRSQVLRALAESSATVTSRHHATMAAGLDILRQADMRAEIAQITIPVRLLHGAKDALMPAEAAVALAELLPEARLSLLDDCGHAPHLSRPEDCAALIGGFLSE